MKRSAIFKINRKIVYQLFVIVLVLILIEKPSFRSEFGELRTGNQKYDVISMIGTTDEIYSYDKRFAMLKGQEKNSEVEMKLILDSRNNSLSKVEDMAKTELFPEGAKSLILKIGEKQTHITPFIYENRPNEIINGVVHYNKIQFDGKLYLKDIYTDEISEVDLKLNEEVFEVSNITWSPDGKILWIMVNDKFQFLVFAENLTYKRLYELEKNRLGISFIKKSRNSDIIFLKTNRIAGKGLLTKVAKPYILDETELVQISLKGMNDEYSKNIVDFGMSDYGKYIYVISEKMDSHYGDYGVNLYDIKNRKWKNSYIPRIGMDTSVAKKIDINTIRWGKNDYSFLLATERYNAFGYKYFYRKVISSIGISFKRFSFYDKYKNENEEKNKIFWAGNKMYQISEKSKLYRIY